MFPKHTLACVLASGVNLANSFVPRTLRWSHYLPWVMQAWVYAGFFISSMKNAFLHTKSTTKDLIII